MLGLPDFNPETDEIIDHQVVPHDAPVTDRSIARRVALKVLYELDTTNHRVSDVLQYHLDHDPDSRRIHSYLRRLVTGIWVKVKQLDELLQRYAPEWPIDQVSVVDRNILRIALYEFGVEDRTPVGVAIDEAIELAKLYGSDGTTRFVNGVLGALAIDLNEVREQLAEPDETTA